MSFIVHARNFWNLNPLEDEKIRIVEYYLGFDLSIVLSFSFRSCFRFEQDLLDAII